MAIEDDLEKQDAEMIRGNFNTLRSALETRVRQDSILIEPLAHENEENRCVIRYEDGVWKVYYVERGKRTSLSVFDNAFDAARFFYWWVTGAPDHYAAARSKPR